MPPEDITTHAYSVTSYLVLLMAAKDMGDIPQAVDMDEVFQNKTYLTVLQNLKSRISGAQEPGTNIINITAISEDPESAARMADSVAGAYQRYDIDRGNEKVKETKRFVEQQMERTLRELKQAEMELREFKEQHAVYSIDTQTRELLRRLSEVRKDQDDVVEERKWIDKLLSLYDQETPGSYKTIAELIFPGGKEDTLFPFLQQRFETLRLEKRELLLQFTPEHPRVKALEGKIQIVIEEAGKQLQTRREHLLKQETKLADREQELILESNQLPESSQELAKRRRKVDLNDKLYSQLQEKHQNLLIQASGTMAEVSMVKRAIVPSSPYNVPSKLLIIFTGLILGLILGFVAAFGIEAFDTSMGTIEDLEELLQVPVLGVIPSMFLERKEGRHVGDAEDDERADLIVHFDPKSLASEAFRTLRTNLQFLGMEKKNKSFIITSSYLQEGKTLNCANLAVSLAQNGARVLLVEADLRRSKIHKIFGLNREPGLTDYIMDNCEIEETINTITDVLVGELEIDDVLSTPGLDNLHVVTAGTKPQNPSEVLNSERFKQFVRSVYKDYDYILFDVPPALPVSDASQMATLVDGVILVYTAGRIARSVLKRAKDMLETVHANVIGVILNSVRPEIGPEYLKYHSKYYYSEADEIRSKHYRSAGMEQANMLTSLILQNKGAVGAVLVVTLLLLISLFWNLS